MRWFDASPRRATPEGQQSSISRTAPRIDHPLPHATSPRSWHTPVPQGPVVDPQVPGHLRDRLAGRDHHLHGLSLELRAELAAMLRHETDPLSRAESHCPRSLIHLNPALAGVAHRLRPGPAVTATTSAVVGTRRAPAILAETRQTA